jgi:uncharacterized protein (TIGR02270 family)
MKTKPSVIAAVLDQHAEEAASHWLIRDGAVYAPHYSLSDLAHLDDRLDAHIDGLRIAAEYGWDISKKGLSEDDTGSLFAAAVLSFERDQTAIEPLIDVGSVSTTFSRGLISALGWLTYQETEKRITPLLNASLSSLRRIGIAASAIHRRDPGQALIDALADDDVFLRTRALQAVGELGLRQLLPSVQKNLASANYTCGFSAAWAAALLGDLDSVSVLQAIAGLDLPYKEEAATLAFRRMDVATALTWQKQLADNAESVRLAVMGAGAAGDPTLIPWLINQMKVSELARVAGESFTMITGVDIAYEDFEGERPEGFESGPTEDPEDETVEMDPDENLPWPNPELIQKWWTTHRSNFQNGTRYLIGKPITADWLQQVLRIGKQRQRAAAALELVLRRPGQPLFEVRAPGFRQQQMLGLKVTR